MPIRRRAPGTVRNRDRRRLPDPLPRVPAWLVIFFIVIRGPGWTCVLHLIRRRVLADTMLLACGTALALRLRIVRVSSSSSSSSSCSGWNRNTTILTTCLSLALPCRKNRLIRRAEEDPVLAPVVVEGREPNLVSSFPTILAFVPVREQPHARAATACCPASPGSPRAAASPG